MIMIVRRHRALAALFAASFALVLGGFFWAFAVLRGVREPLVLHWSDLAGITRFGGTGDLLAIGVFGLVVLVLDAGLAFALEEREPAIGRTVAGAGVFVSVLLFILFAAIISAN